MCNQKLIKLFITAFLLLCVTFPLSTYAARKWKKDPFSTITTQKNIDDILILDGDNNALIKQMDIEVLADASIRIQGIWIIDSLYKAMISDSIYVIGDKINDYIIVNIQNNKILFRDIQTKKIYFLELK